MINDERVDIVRCSDIVDSTPGPEDLLITDIVHYDALLIDILWPNGAPYGIEIVKRVRLEYPDFPIVAFSGQAESAHFQGLIEYGISAYISKRDLL